MRGFALSLLASTAFALPQISPNVVDIVPNQKRQTNEALKTYGKFAVLGDSFASGVAWMPR